MQNFNLKQNKKENLYYQKEKELFLHLLKDKDDISRKKVHNTYITKLKNSINNGLILLDNTEILNDKDLIKKRNFFIKNNNTFSNNNSKNNLKIISSWKNINKKNYLNQKKMPTTTTDANKIIKNFFEEKHNIQKRILSYKNRNDRRIKSSYTCREKNNINKYFNSDYFETSKEFHISQRFNKSNKINMYPTYSIESHNKEKIFNRNSNNTNNSLKSPKTLISKIVNKPFLSSSPNESKEKNDLFLRKFKAEKKIKRKINNTLLKFDRKKLKFYSNKKIEKCVQKLSENKINKIHHKDSMKEYFSIKKILDDVIRKKKKNVNEFQRSSLLYKKMLNKKNFIYKKAIKKYFSGPNREMKSELSKYIKNRYFIVDADNNPYKFRIFNSMHNF